MKIAPRYTEPTVHVLDASKSVVVVRNTSSTITFGVVLHEVPSKIDTCEVWAINEALIVSNMLLFSSSALP